MKLSALVVVLMGVITGVFGGVLRDTELYATCSFGSVWVFVILMRVAPDTQRASLIGTGVVVLLRLLSVRFKLMLPDPRDTGRLSGRAR
jgi:uncharacterized membrane protein YeiH